MKRAPKTTHPHLKDLKLDEKWYVLDAEGKVLGQVATKLATVIRGRHKPSWHPSVNGGDHVIVVNADKVVLTGLKEDKKLYIHHTLYMGGIKTSTARKMREDHPERMIEKAVAGMLPKNRLRQHALAKLHVYAGAEHPHSAQTPQPLSL